MKKVFVIMAMFLFVASLEAQEKEALRLRFNYENASTWRTAVGDTVTGVAAAAASLDTVYLSAMGSGNRIANLILCVVDITDVNNADTLDVHIQQGYDNSFEGTSTTNTFNPATDGFFEIRLDAGQQAAPQYRIIFDGTKGADTDSTAYTLKAVGIFDKR